MNLSELFYHHNILFNQLAKIGDEYIESTSITDARRWQGDIT